MKTSRNRPCPCGSGKKFKRCCGALGNPLRRYGLIHRYKPKELSPLLDEPLPPRYDPSEEAERADRRAVLRGKLRFAGLLGGLAQGLGEDDDGRPR